MRGTGGVSLGVMYRPCSLLSLSAPRYEGGFALPQAVCHLMPTPWAQKELVKTKTPKLSGTKLLPTYTSAVLFTEMKSKAL